MGPNRRLTAALCLPEPQRHAAKKARDMTEPRDELTKVITDLRQDWDLTRYAGAYEERMTARDKVIGEAIRRLPECVPLGRGSPRSAWRWTHKWSRDADPVDVVTTVLTDKPDAIEQLKAAVVRVRRGPEILNNLRVQWAELQEPVLGHDVGSVLKRRKNLISDAKVHLPDVVRDIAFFRAQPNNAPVCEWNSGADRENITEAVLNNEVGAMDRLCAAMDPPVLRSGYEVLSELRDRWASLKEPVRNLGLLRYAETIDPEIGDVEEITLESVNAEWRMQRENWIDYAIERLPAITSQIAPSLRWRSDVNLREVAEAVLNGDEGAIERLYSAMAPSGEKF